MAKQTQTKLRPIIHSAYTYFLSTLLLEDYASAISNVKELQLMLSNVRNEAEGMYGNTLPQGLEYKLSGAEYVLRRVLELDQAGTLQETDDLSVFGDSLYVRFEALVEELESIDQEPI